jgi:hypothetical protein
MHWLRQGSSVDTWDARAIPSLSNERLAASYGKPERLPGRDAATHVVRIYCKDGYE